MSGDQWGFGNPEKQEAFDHSMMDDGTPFDLVFGEFPHSRSDNDVYARFADGSVEDFDGHRVLVRVSLRSMNYLKCSGLSGNEVRKGGWCMIEFNGRKVR